ATPSAGGVRPRIGTMKDLRNQRHRLDDGPGGRSRASPTKSRRFPSFWRYWRPGGHVHVWCLGLPEGDSKRVAVGVAMACLGLEPPSGSFACCPPRRPIDFSHGRENAPGLRNGGVFNSAQKGVASRLGAPVGGLSDGF